MPALRISNLHAVFGALVFCILFIILYLQLPSPQIPTEFPRLVLSDSHKQVCRTKGDCYPKIFNPTNTWTRIRNGQVLQNPNSLEIKTEVDERWARIPSEHHSKFIPTRQWQTVYDGKSLVFNKVDQILPPGLEIQMDTQTGEKRARLMPPNEIPKGEPITASTIEAALYNV